MEFVVMFALVSPRALVQKLARVVVRTLVQQFARVAVRALVQRLVRESASLLTPVMVIAVLVVTMLGLMLSVTVAARFGYRFPG